MTAATTADPAPKATAAAGAAIAGGGGNGAPAQPVAPRARRRPPRDGDAILRVEGMVKAFGALCAVDGVDVEVRRGEVLGVIGPNGSGKTTLVNCLSGFASPTSGRVRWNGRDVTGKRPDAVARLGLVRTFQQPMVFPSYGPRQHCELVAGLGSRNDAGRLDLFSGGDVGEILRFAELGDVAAQPAASLSYGQVRRLGLASALAARPEMLVLDEPGAGLTSRESSELRERLLDLRDRGLTLLVIDHDMSFLMPMCDRVIVLDAGRKIAEGTPAEVQSDPRVIAAYLGDRFAERADLVARAGAG